MFWKFKGSINASQHKLLGGLLSEQDEIRLMGLYKKRKEDMLTLASLFYYFMCILLWIFKWKRYTHLKGFDPGNLSRSYAPDERDEEESGHLISVSMESAASCKSTRTPNSLPAGL